MYLTHKLGHDLSSFAAEIVCLKSALHLLLHNAVQL